MAKNDARMKAGPRSIATIARPAALAPTAGESSIFPPLAGNPIISQTSGETLARVVTGGTQNANTPGTLFPIRITVIRLAA